MLKFNHPDFLMIALPDAPHHAATLTEVPVSGEAVSRSLKGHITIDGVATGGRNPGIRLPQVIQMRELFEGSAGDFEHSPTVISIPWSAVKSVSVDVLSDDRWTFVWAESGEEVASFRPRKVAESIRVDLVSDGVLTVSGGEVSIPLREVSEVRTDFVPIHDNIGDFSDHFVYYMPYIQVPGEGPAVSPKKLGREARRSPVTAGNAFAGVSNPRVWPWFACFMVEVD
jgi:hypothetical protein